MPRKYQVISGDGHVETPPLFNKYVPNKYMNRAPRLITLPDGGGDAWLVEGAPLSRIGKNVTGGRTAKTFGESYTNPDGTPIPGTGSAVQRLKEQDQDGIDAEILYPPVYVGPLINNIGDKQVYYSIVQAYNTWLAQDYCSIASDRLIGNAVIPTSGIDHAIDELKRCKELGLRSVSLSAFPNGGPGPKPEDMKFWEAALSLGLGISPHLSFGSFQGVTMNAGQRGPREAAQEFAKSAGGFSAIPSMVQLMVDGVLDRLPDLRIYYAESNGGWVPYFLRSLDLNYDIFKTWYGVNLKMKPSEYALRHFYFGLVIDPLAAETPEVMPWDNFMWGSDFPHAAGTYPHSRDYLADGRAGVPKQFARKVVLENPAEFFKLDLERPITETPKG